MYKINNNEGIQLNDNIEFTGGGTGIIINQNTNLEGSYEFGINTYDKYSFFANDTKSALGVAIGSNDPLMDYTVPQDPSNKSSFTSIYGSEAISSVAGSSGQVQNGMVLNNNNFFLSYTDFLTPLASRVQYFISTPSYTGIATGITGYPAQLKSDNLSSGKTFQFPDASGTIALTSDITGSISGATSQVAYFDSANSITGSSNYTFDGTTLNVPNLIVGGTTTTVNSTVVAIEDPIFVIGGTATQTIDDNKDRGIQFNYNNGSTSKYGFFGFDDSDSRFKFIPDATNTNEVITGSVGDVEFNVGYFNEITVSGTTGINFGSSNVNLSESGGEFFINVDASQLYFDTSAMYFLPDTSNTSRYLEFSGPTISYANGAGSIGFLDLGSSITTNRTWTMPDAGGTVALLTDIPSTPSLENVLAINNITNGNNLQITNDDYLEIGSTGPTWQFKKNSGNNYLEVFNSDEGFVTQIFDQEYFHSDGISVSERIRFASGGYNTSPNGSLLSDTLTSSRSWTLPDNSGTIALTTDIPDIAIGGTVTSSTNGSVLFIGSTGLLQQDNSNFYWDDVLNRLGIGTNTPNVELHVKGNSSILRLETISLTNNNYIEFYDPTERKGFLGYVSTLSTDSFFIRNEEHDAKIIISTTDASGTSFTGIEIDGDQNVTIPIGNLGVGTNTPEAKLNVVGSSAGGVVFKVDGTTGDPIFEVEDTNEVRLGDNTAPAGFTTAKLEVTGATGANGVHNIDMTTYDMATFDYVAIGGTTNYRAGTIQAVWDGTTYQYYENATTDIGDTSPVTFDFAVGATVYGATATDITLVATVTTTPWTIKTIIKTI